MIRQILRPEVPIPIARTYEAVIVIIRHNRAASKSTMLLKAFRTLALVWLPFPYKGACQ
jgi:hypothetical protein